MMEMGVGKVFRKLLMTSWFLNILGQKKSQKFSLAKQICTDIDYSWILTVSELENISYDRNKNVKINKGFQLKPKVPT